MSGNDLIPFLLESNHMLEIAPEQDAALQGTFDTLGTICVLIPSLCTATLGIFADTRIDLVNQETISLYF